VHDRLGDRVTHWTTFNEPLCSSLIAYAGGEHAPGRTEPAAGLAALHHQHLAHGLAVASLRERGAEQLGITLNLTNAVPDDPRDPADLDAARRIDALWNRAFLEPLLLGRYPEDFLADVAGHGFEDVVRDGDLALIAQPIDFLGVNHYHDDNVSGRPLPPGTPPALRPTDKPGGSPFVGSEFVTFPPRDLPRTAMGWEVNPDGLRTLLVRLGREYPSLPPLYVTENGSAYDDEVSADGAVHDTERVAYLRAHVDAVRAAIAEGADVRGYFAWSLLDNFEWAWGYDKRFGIVRVDYETQERIVKDSGRVFAELIRGS
jgi:beta-glucosidase